MSPGTENDADDGQEGPMATLHAVRDALHAIGTSSVHVAVLQRPSKGKSKQSIRPKEKRARRQRMNYLNQTHSRQQTNILPVDTSITTQSCSAAQRGSRSAHDQIWLSRKGSWLQFARHGKSKESFTCGTKDEGTA